MNKEVEELIEEIADEVLEEDGQGINTPTPPITQSASKRKLYFNEAINSISSFPSSSLPVTLDPLPLPPISQLDSKLKASISPRTKRGKKYNKEKKNLEISTGIRSTLEMNLQSKKFVGLNTSPQFLQCDSSVGIKSSGRIEKKRREELSPQGQWASSLGMVGA